MAAQMFQDLDRDFNKAVCDVFGLMLNYEMQSAPAVNWNGDGDLRLAGCVALGGRVTGVVYLHATENFARRIASRLLAVEEDELENDEIVNDAIGEITNMIVGPVKSRLSECGLTTVMTIPSVVRGSSFSIEPTTSTERQIFGYRCAEGEVALEVLIRTTELR